ncbi:MAG: LLM class flavin-dependent oxidoreductase [Gammaproteobacteria bacterium]|nr:LLM class flavin-dependent oxidoreductase [Gammaproteobacteria bacterium]
MTRRMLFNAFQMNCVTHQSPGLWTRDDDQTTRYKELDYWLDYARLVERGCFDAVFLADVVGTYDVYGGNREAALRSAAQTPVNDPMLVIPAMATVTRHLGFGVTSAMLQYHPYTFARQMSTLDHLTKGRIGWNVVTGYLDSAARAYGLEALPEHDQRYEIADEYASLCYRLWEDSWAEDAVRADRKSGVYTDPSRVRDIDHDGRYYRVHGCHVSEPSPQRTPVLFQAGSSARGTDFAARHAECVFVIGSKPHVAGDYARTVREKAVAAGRRGEDVAVFAYMKVVVGGTEAEAKRKYDDLFESVDIDGALALMCGWSGMDLSTVAMDQPIEYIETNAIRTFLHSFTAGDPSRVWTPRDIARYCGIGGAGPVLVGTPEQLADQLEDWIAAGVDGFNLAHTVLPGGLEDFIDGVVPVLQSRGRMQREYQPGTLREKLFGHARVQAPHPAATCRRPWG